MSSRLSRRWMRPVAQEMTASSRILFLFLNYMILVILLFYFVLLATLACIYFRADTNGSLYLAVFDWLPRHLGFCVRKTFGSKGLGVLRGCFSYVCEKRNPLGKYLYHILINGGFYLFVIHGFPMLTADIHKYLMLALYVGCLWSFVKAAWSDPGIITKANVKHELERYPYDKYIFPGKHDCPTCKTPKPARSKHCRMLNVCVARADHYCIWLDNMTGLYNYKYFLLFLLLHSIICIYASSLIASVFMDLIKSKRIFTVGFYDRFTGKKIPATWTIVAQFFLGHYFALCAVFLLCIVLAVFLSLFLAYHLRLVLSGCTTNETVKWDIVNDTLKPGVPLENIYDRGYWRNLKDALNLL